jgi:adenylate cyclase
MTWLRHKATRFIDSGVQPHTPSSDARYIRFLNATLLLFGLGQVPILSLLFTLGLESQLPTNLAALGLCGVGFMLNRRGQHLAAKILVITVVTANTTYFAAVLGSSAPTHLWLIPGAVLGVLAFKPSEWAWAAALVGFSMITFFAFEFMQPEMEPMVDLFSDPLDELQAAQGSTVFAMLLTLVLVGMMHRRFAQSESALSQEKAQSDRLLRAILPEEIARELRETGATQAVRHEDVSLLFADIVGFTPLAASMPAEEVVAVLAKVFERFDDLIARCGVEKIKTIGDAYMVAGGVPKTMPDHAERLARCALGMMEIIGEFSADSGHPLELRIGLHRGPVVAGVIGTTKFAYDLWGESVNLASRLESSGKPGRIHVSDAFREGSDQTMHFDERGEIELKGVGMTRTHWLVRTDTSA